MRKLIILTFALMLNGILFAQVYSDKDVEVCKTKFQLSVDGKLQKEPINNVVAAIGRSFIGTEYIAHTLEKKGKEELTINLTGLDCTTFLETSLTFARCIKLGKTSFEDYQKQLTLIRYRDGKLDEYPSRLHYFSDWIYNNSQKGIVKDVTKSIGGEKITFKLSFMSTHPDSYQMLKDNPKFVPMIAEQEKEINKREYYYIPVDKVEKNEKKIKNGDLIAITVNVPGIDIGHVGIAVKEKDGRIYFMHAPLSGAKVQITKEPLCDYLKKIKKDTGIIVLRPQEPVK
jgi:hypothetical protein